jgi:hypothetical protein
MHTCRDDSLLSSDGWSRGDVEVKVREGRRGRREEERVVVVGVVYSDCIGVAGRWGLGGGCIELRVCMVTVAFDDSHHHMTRLHRTV